MNVGVVCQARQLDRFVSRRRDGLGEVFGWGQPEEDVRRPALPYEAWPPGAGEV